MRKKKKIMKELLFKKVTMNNKIHCCGSCGNGVGYVVPGPVGCSS